MEECLTYFRNAIEQPTTSQRWPEWWEAHAELVRQNFDREDYLRLKFHRLIAARLILERMGRPVVEPPTVNWWDRTHCPKCAEPLIRFIPGAMPTRDEIIAFGHRSGIEVCQRGYGLHHGVYCPFGYVDIMMEFRPIEECGS